MSEVFDVIGIGYGPASLATSIALVDRNARQPPAKRIRATWIESHPSFQWHPGMMIEGSRMQISFLKDLATMRDPTSAYTFLAYLHEHDRMATFINCSTFAPTRREFADYLTWAAGKVAASQDSGVSVNYSESVEAVEPVIDEQGCSLLRVISRRKGRTIERLARNLLVSSGGQGRIPEKLQSLSMEDRTDMIHSSEYLHRLSALLDHLLPPVTALASPLHKALRCCADIPCDLRPPTPPSSNVSDAGTPASPAMRTPRVAIIGAGQSAAEIFLNLHNQLPRDAEVDLIIRRGALRPSDDSPFSNETFDPANTDLVHDLGVNRVSSDVKRLRVGLGSGAEAARGGSRSASADGRQRVLQESQTTNYAVVNPNTLEAVYEAMYAQRVEEDLLANGRAGDTPLSEGARMRILPYREIEEGCRTETGQICLRLKHTLHNEEYGHVYDAVICATGYDRQTGRKMLVKGLGHLFDEDLGTCEVQRDYHLEMPSSTKDGKAFRPQVWLQGSQEATHGISDSLLSVVAIRAGEIVTSLEKHANLV